MKDFDFKRLNHKFKNYNITLRGGKLADGYKPDMVLCLGESYIILECENGTSRKHFIGGLLKAAKFLTGDKEGILVYVILIKKNTTERQIAKHLRPYLDWISSLTSLREVYIISDEKYLHN